MGLEPVSEAPILALPVLIWPGLMKTQVEFRSGKFPPYDGEQEQINPGLWGKRLAEYLREKLQTDGIKTGDIYSEDWGWALPIQNGRASLDGASGDTRRCLARFATGICTNAQ